MRLFRCIFLVCVFCLLLASCPGSDGGSEDNSGGPGEHDIVGNGNQTITGWRTVTKPLDATGTGIRIDIGGGNFDHIDLSTLDPGNLGPGDVVNIFHRLIPYNTRLAFITDGTEDHPIIINGVTDTNGNRPQINCADATTVQEEDWSSYIGGQNGNHACWVLHTSQNGGTYGDPTSWVEFRNLEMYGAHPDNRAEFNGAYYNYSTGAAPIRIQTGEHITIAGSIFHHNGNGFFSADSFPNKSIKLSGNKFEDNGIADSFSQHQIYFQAVASVDEPFTNIIEGNYIAEPLPGMLGGAVKMRGSDGIIRYNYIVGSARAIDLVEAQESLPSYIYDNFTDQQIRDRYRSAYIYGNVIMVDRDEGFGVAGPFHLSGDSPSAAVDNNTWSGSGSNAGQVIWRGYESPVYVYHNTLWIKTDFYRQAIFDFDLGGSGANSYTSQAQAANNLFVILNTNASDLYVTHAQHTGRIEYTGTNHLHMDNATGNSPYEGRDLNNDPDIEIVGGVAPTLITNAGDPLFIQPTGDFETRDYALDKSSSAVGAAGNLSSAMLNFPVLLQPVRPGLGGGAVERSSTNDLGAIE